MLEILPKLQTICLYMYSMYIHMCVKFTVSTTNISGFVDINVTKRTNMAVK